ncbi:MAG: dephospho-CoA kinase [Pseudomonadota bacterium]
MIIIGLTGSIGMGKSAVAAMFIRAGIPLFDADRAVHQLQGPDGALLPQIEARFPGTTGPSGVDRQKLGSVVFGNAEALRVLERIVHPAVAALRRDFLRRNRSRPIVVLDIPLLFEKKGWKSVDQILVVSAPAWKQRRRVLARPGMSYAKFAKIRKLQLPDAQKRKRADFVITTGTLRTVTIAEVRQVIACLTRQTGR